MSILLSDDYIEDWCDFEHPVPNTVWGVKQLAKSAAIHAVQYLREPCTEHWQPFRKLTDEERRHITYTTGGYLPTHRYLCPDCMANIKKELEQ